MIRRDLELRTYYKVVDLLKIIGVLQKKPYEQFRRNGLKIQITVAVFKGDESSYGLETLENEYTFLPHLVNPNSQDESYL